MNHLKKGLVSTLLAGVLLAGCGAKGEAVQPTQVDLNALTTQEIETKAKEEGKIQSVGMPDTWANWGETWAEIEKKHGLTQADTDMSSAEEIALFEAEKENATKDIGDVGQSFGPIAEDKGVTLPYKTSYWDEIPAWAKDDDGDWIVGYTGTISFITNTNAVKEAPTSFADILKGDYKVSIGDVNAATQAQNGVLAAAIANGGDETNLEPGIAFFAELASQGRLDMGDTDLARLEAGEIEVGIYWDFNALNYADSIEASNPDAAFLVTIPQDGTVQSGYATIINAYAPHPHAAALAREYILSDEGQINLAKGYARPIRESVKLPADVQEKLIVTDQYGAAQSIKDTTAWDKAAATLGQTWQEDVLTKVK
ncbi:putative spermidine/putrescine transport system substrate-binding protein [Carnobacterium iners]|uniref:Putative spermidine/putrescine transport system substrate-binding protein n=1 Tax=Carnobacterium iners TaxID=1073423 RepID=A0A1X7NAA9_9LACT|nr:ABC transporter substrate-binding protein [Carnobacterium iners]SEL07898.1 putative spermidine/putrescine transport system substrate-binding protein [Carnobacterium iners]SMH33999.1 putative spermidine/putrescine transport system substrate-binding protein [Carnobacterium iners]